MSKSLRSVGKITAIFSALLLAGGHVASRAVPGLLRSIQVYGGEGGGRTVVAPQEGGRTVAAPQEGTSDKTIIGSSKSWSGITYVRLGGQPSQGPTIENRASRGAGTAGGNHAVENDAPRLLTSRIW